MSDHVSNMRIGRELVARNLVPKNCHSVKVLIAASGRAVIRYDVFVSPEDMAKFADALKAASETPETARVVK